jgi:hypothetical protein
MSDVIDLAGTWQLLLDPDDEGIRRRVHLRGLPRGMTIDLPASQPERGIGNAPDALTSPWTAQGPVSPAHAVMLDPSERRNPYWLTPRTVFVGPAWYEREIDVPADWIDRRIVLHLERPHWQTQTFVDGRLVASGDSLATPHEHDLTDHLTPGRRHRLTVRVDNRRIVDVGPNSHSISDHTQGNWNGMVGAIELRATSRVWIDHVEVRTDIDARVVRLRVSIGNKSGRAGMGSVKASARGVNQSTVVAWDAGGTAVDLDMPLGPDALLWDEFEPALHAIDVKLECTAGTLLDEKRIRTGLRKVGRHDRQLTINHRPLFLRGTLECCIFPLTGYPPCDVEPWHRIMRIVKAHGLNHIRFHSYCPPEAAFDAADEAGVYLQVECSSWPNQGATVGGGRPLDQWLFDEARRIVSAYGHHPSFCFMLAGNEPAGTGHEAFLSAWVTYWRRHDPQRLHSTGAGWPVRPESDFHSDHTPRIQRWGEGLKSRINDLPPETFTDYRSDVLRTPGPLVTHEIGQWCAFPNLDEIPKYQGVMRADNFAIVRDRLERQGRLHLAASFLHASGKLQALCYKEEIEASLRTPQLGGFQLLDLHDFPGQGTAPVGVLDAFWDDKGYIRDHQFRRFCNSTVPLARLRARSFAAGMPIIALIEVAHYGPEPIESACVQWSLLNPSGTAVRRGTLDPTRIGVGLSQSLGTLEIDTTGLAAPSQYRLVVGLAGTNVENDWDLWVYPAHLDAPAGETVVTRSVEHAMVSLRAGKRVLLNPPSDAVRTSAQLGFSSIFWNTQWTENQPPHTMGILCDPGHPALADFPTEAHTNWQWWELMHAAACLELSEHHLTPIVGVIDDWNRLRSLAMIIEVNVGQGRLVLCTADISTDLPRRVVARQLRHSLLQYMAGPRFEPSHEWDEDRLKAVLR